jgi:hypothetical protein
MIDAGAQASGGIGRKSSKTGNAMPRNTGSVAINKANGTPTPTAAVKPMRTRPPLRTQLCQYPRSPISRPHGEKDLGIELRPEPSRNDVRTLLDEVGTCVDERAVGLVHVVACRDAPGEPLGDEPRSGRLPNDRGVEFVDAKPARDELDALVQVSRGRDLLFGEHRPGEAVRAAAFRHGDRLAIEPLKGGLRIRKRRRIVAREEHVALVPTQPDMGHDADIGNLSLRGPDDRGHIAHVTDLLLACQHRVDEDRALQADVELDRRSGRQILLPQRPPVEHDARPRLRIVGLIPHDQMNRLARLAVGGESRRIFLRR